MRTDLRIGMFRVVDDLILVADGRVLILEHEVLHPAVGARRGFPFPAQVEVVVGLSRDDVAGTTGILAIVGWQGQRAVVDLPARLAGVGFLVTAPSGERLAVEERRPGSSGRGLSVVRFLFGVW